MPTPSRPPQRINTVPATLARVANVRLRKAWAAQALLEALGCVVTWPETPHADISHATIKR